MTTAPTPSEAERLAEALHVLASRFTTPPPVRGMCNAAIHELGRLQAENERLLGQVHKLEMDVLDLASENSILKRQEAEELEARKPLPCAPKLGPSQRGEKCSLGTVGCVVIHDDDERKPLSGLDAMRMGMEVARECRGHATGTTNWATAMTRAYERRLCGITGGSS